MPHLRLEYPSELSSFVDLAAFCDHMRAAMLDVGIFPRAGIRVRGHASDCVSVADGGNHLFLHMELIIGMGRTEADKDNAIAKLYAAAEASLKPQIGDKTFALSLELREITKFNEKRWNTIRSAIGD